MVCERLGLEKKSAILGRQNLNSKGHNFILDIIIRSLKQLKMIQTLEINYSHHIFVVYIFIREFPVFNKMNENVR